MKSDLEYFLISIIWLTALVFFQIFFCEPILKWLKSWIETRLKRGEE